MSIKRIAIPTDFSEIAKRGVDMGVSVAQRTGAELHLINSVQAIPGVYTGHAGTFSPSVQQATTAILEDHENKLKELAQELEKQNIKVKTEATPLPLKDRMKAYVKGQQIDMLVMGTEKGYKLLDYLLGKNTRNVIDKVGCPVLSVRNEGQVFRPGKIVVPLDGNMDKEKEANMEPLKEMINDYGSTVHLLNILPGQENQTEEVINRMEELASKNGLNDYSLNVVQHDDPIRAINNFCNKKNAEMIAVKYDGSGLFRRIFVSDYIDDLLSESNVPVLAFHDERQ